MRPATDALCLLLAALCLMSTPRAQAQTTTLRMGLPVSTDSPTGQNLREFARQVQARTGGALKIDIDGKSLHYEQHDVVTAVGSGAVELGATSLAQFAKDVPLCAAFLQPFLFNFDALIEAATRQESEIRTLIEQEILNWTHARVLWWEPYGSSVILSRKVPASNPAAIASRSIGAPDEQTKALFRTCGGTPQLVPPADVSKALQRGAIQAAATDIMSVREHELWRVADTITNLRHAPSLFVVVINEKAWQSLSPEHRSILSELGQDAQSYMWARFATVRAEAYAFAAGKGMRIVDLPAEDVAAWRACSAPLIETYMERAGELGPKLFGAYGRLRTNACCREPPADIPFVAR